MSEFTGGDWKVREVIIWPAAQAGYAIDFNDDQGQVADYVYEEADAHLISAAKELYEALEEMLDGYLYGTDMETKRENISRARNALAKAKGEQQ